MKKMIVALIVVIIIGIYISQSTYQRVDDESIQTIVQKENLVLLDSKIMDTDSSSFAVIYYQDQNQLGTGIITISGKTPKLAKELEIAEQHDQPVQYLGTKSGYPYVGITIHDKEILKYAKTITLKLPDQKPQVKNVQKPQSSFLFVGTKSLQNSSNHLQYEIKNDTGEILYEKNY
ncbi:hypothetical protein [Paenibacillus wulumuqiensis]|uniref:hypothetical protein n=1 Tax=Paenibacillus wulumuqiensis TaxID=1567107 RepID=UPI000AB9FFA4|nr:hypothetical protein [Paenibacillus wulumuqiensis]